MKLTIAVSSGKGGTGKTFVTTSLAKVLEREGRKVTVLDCDVEEPNSHLFLDAPDSSREPFELEAPIGIDASACTACGACVEACTYNALAKLKDNILFFKNLCHICGACSIVCPHDAIQTGARVIGECVSAYSGELELHYGLLETGEGGMSPRLIQKVKEKVGEGVTILDSPPGTSCPVVETVKDADVCVLVTDPTPFGINDLKLAVNMCRQLGHEPAVIVNRAEYHDNKLKEYCANEGLAVVGEIPDERKIAECYSEGRLVVNEFEEYSKLFSKIACNIAEYAFTKKLPLANKPTGTKDAGSNDHSEVEKKSASPAPQNTKELVVISGKGGTGKTSIAAALCSLAGTIAIADCDVDAADMHLVLPHEVKQTGVFSGSNVAVIDKAKCAACGLCRERCAFGAIRLEYADSKLCLKVDSSACEGCRVCGLICPRGAVSYKPKINGNWYTSTTPYGPMAHAKLGIAEENSGKLVSLLRRKKDVLAREYNIEHSIIDGSPGTGCPVIASVTGAEYALVVTEPTVAGLHDMKRVLDLTAHFKIKSGVVVNKSDLNQTKTNEAEKTARAYDADFIGTIPYDKNCTLAQMEGVSLIEFGDGPASQALRDVWRQLQKKLKLPVNG